MADNDSLFLPGVHTPEQEADNNLTQVLFVMLLTLLKKELGALSQEERAAFFKQAKANCLIGLTHAEGQNVSQEMTLRYFSEARRWLGY